jgi:hypothetical protein
MLKRTLAYHKSNGITTMKKHIEFEENTLLKKYVERINNHPKLALEC